MFTTPTEVISNTTEPILNVSTSKTSRYGPYQHHANNADDFHFYGIGVVIPFGLLGNLFSICIFLLSPILRRTTTGHFLVALAIADSTVLVGEVIRWLSDYVNNGENYLHKSLGLDIYDTSIVACSIAHYLRYGGGLCSVWLTIAIAMERLAAVAFPLRISLISTLRRSRVSIFIIAVISFSLATFSFWSFYINSEPQCLTSRTYYKEYQIWITVIIQYGTLIIPGVVIAIITLIIIVLLYRARSKRMSHLTGSVQGQRKQHSNVGLSTEIQLTIMLVAVCVATTALRAPYTIAYFLRQPCWFRGSCNTLRDAQTFVAFRVTEVFNVLNYAINFILYCFSGRSFREQIRKGMCRGKRDGSNFDTQQISLETPPTPLLGSNIRQLKATPNSSSMAQTNDV